MAELDIYKSLNDNFFYKLGGQLYEYIVERYGDDDENAGLELTIPFMCDGWCKGSTGYSAEYFVNGLYNTHIYTDYMLHVNIDGNYNTENFIDMYVPIWRDSRVGDVTIQQAYDRINSSGTSGEYLTNAINELDYAQLQAEQFKLRLNDGMSQQTIFSQYTNYGTQYYTELFTYNDNTKIFDSFTRYNVYQRPPVDVLNVSKIKFDTRSNPVYMNIAHSSNAVNTDFSFDRSFNFFTITDNGTASNVYNNNNSTYNNSFQYTTENGDTINVYYGDNYIDLGVGGFGTGGAGLVGFNYNDFRLIMDDIIDDLKINVPDINLSDDLQFPSFEDIKYSDMGSFYITPIKQIDKLPTAPDVGYTVPDIGDYLTVVGGAVNSLYNMIDGLGVSLMLVFTFLLCLVINHLKKE